MSCVSSAIVLIACSWWAEPEAGARAADLVTLRDGKTITGELIEPWSPGSVGVYVRRARARENVPDLADRWESAEKPSTRQANTQRLERLEAWQRDRTAATPVKGDRITPWIEREQTRLRAEGDQSSSTILIARIPRNDVRNVTRAPRGRSRLLRLAWTAKLPNPELLSVDDLKGALDSRGLDVDAKDPVSIEALLPPRPETESAWLIRRAATEVSFDPDLKFIRHQGLVLPESETALPANAGSALAGVAALKELFGEKQADPLAARLREIRDRGRVGAVVTRLEIAPDFSMVGVEIALWVRHKGDNWTVSGSRSARVRPADLGPDAGKELADDPQVALAFQVVESLGFGEAAQELKQRSLSIGAATRKALGIAREAANADLAKLALPVMDVK